MTEYVYKYRARAGRRGEIPHTLEAVVIAHNEEAAKMKAIEGLMGMGMSPSDISQIVLVSMTDIRLAPILTGEAVSVD